MIGKRHDHRIEFTSPGDANKPRGEIVIASAGASRTRFDYRVEYRGLPAIRWQSVQLIQIVHFLWPPFLCGHQYRSRYRLVSRQLDTILHNLPHSGT